MIQVNLLPQDLRKKNVSSARMRFMPFVILGGVLFLLMTLFFYFDYLHVRSAYRSVHGEWSRLNPLMAQLKALENKIEIEMRGEKDFLEKNVLNTESMTRILASASEFLPPKGWLTALQIDRAGTGCVLILRGVVLSTRAQTGIEQIEVYLQKLKAQLPREAMLELTTSKDASVKSQGTAFTAQFVWGAVKK